MKIDIYCDELYPFYGISETGSGRYNLTEQERADYERVTAEWEAWQDKLAALKPDDYVPPKPLTEEEIAFRKFITSEAGILALQTPE